MADTKISGLPVATSLGLSDIIPVVQVGTTKQATLSLIPVPGTNSYILFNNNGVIGADASLQYAVASGNFLLSLAQNALTQILIQNTSAGTSAQAAYLAKNSSNQANYGITGTSLTPVGVILANEAYLYTDSPIGLLLACNSTTGVIVFSPGGLVEKARFSASGGFSVGDTIDPGVGWIEAKTGYKINGSQIAFSNLAGNVTQAQANIFRNASVGGQTGFASDQYLSGSNVTVPANAWATGFQYHCMFKISKTAAGASPLTYTMRSGTTGSLSDAVIGAATSFPGGAAATDLGYIDVYLISRSAASIIVFTAKIDHQTNGLATTGMQDAGGSGALSSSSNTQLGLSVNLGTGASGNCDYVQAQMLQ
jgi:hypothetical protein